MLTVICVEPCFFVMPLARGYGGCSRDVHAEDVVKKNISRSSNKDMKRLRLCVVRTGLKAGKRSLRARR